MQPGLLSAQLINAVRLQDQHESKRHYVMVQVTENTQPFLQAVYLQAMATHVSFLCEQKSAGGILHSFCHCQTAHHLHQTGPTGPKHRILICHTSSSGHMKRLHLIAPPLSTLLLFTWTSIQVSWEETSLLSSSCRLALAATEAQLSSS